MAPSRVSKPFSTHCRAAMVVMNFVEEAIEYIESTTSEGSALCPGCESSPKHLRYLNVPSTHQQTSPSSAQNSPPHTRAVGCAKGHARKRLCVRPLRGEESCNGAIEGVHDDCKKAYAADTGLARREDGCYMFVRWLLTTLTAEGFGVSVSANVLWLTSVSRIVLLATTTVASGGTPRAVLHVVNERSTGRSSVMIRDA